MLSLFSCAMKTTLIKRIAQPQPPLLFNRFYGIFLWLCALGMASSCNGGLDPIAAQQEQKALPSISGTIIYKGGTSAWPPADSIKDIRVVAFTRYPPPDIIAEVLSQKAYFTDGLPSPADTTAYRITFPSPAPQRIAAVVVAQQYGEDITKQWRVVGIYSTTGDNHPSPIDFGREATQQHIDITVDFSNLPPQPF